MTDVGDGRLELDELGSVIDRASSLDSPRRDDLLEGVDAITWGERLQSAGITPWLRRHRGAVATATALVLVVGVATTTYLRSRPPAQDTTISVVVADWISDGTNGAGVTSDGAGLLASTYRATPARTGDTVRIVGVVGPGIRASTAHAHSDGAAEDGSTIADVAAVVDCDAGDPAVATPDDFRLRVEQTDAYGRSTTGTVGLPLTDGGQWLDIIVGPCFQQQLTEHVRATTTRISGDLAARVLTVEASVHNGWEHNVALSPTTGSGTSVYVAGDLVVAPEGADVVVPVRIRVTDCANPRLDDAYVPDPSGYGASPQPQRDGINLFASAGNGNGNGQFGGALVVSFDPSQQARVTRLLAQMCAGAPTASVTVLAAGNSPAEVARRFPPSGDPSLVGLRMSVDVATGAQYVEIADGNAPEDIRNGATPTIVTAFSEVRGGHARLSVDWQGSCSAVQSPPVVTLTLSSGWRSWPMRATLASRHLLDAYRAACPGLQSGDLAGMGWPTTQPTTS